MEEQITVNEFISQSRDKNFPFFRILYRNLIAIICFIIASVSVGIVYGVLFVKPVYTARCDAIFRIDEYTGTNSISKETSMAKTFLLTLSKFIKSPDVEREARKSDSAIRRRSVDVSYKTDSLIITISYKSDSPEDAKAKLEHYIAAADTQFHQQEPLGDVKEISLVKLQNEYAVYESNNGYRYVFFGFVAGLVLGVGFAMLRYLLDNKLKDKEELEELTGVSLLSYIDKQ